MDEEVGAWEEGILHTEGPLPVMPEKCKSCIFRTDGNEAPINPHRLDEIRAYLMRGTVHICHTPQLAGSEQEYACRGGRDFQLELFAAIGIIPEPTDEALAATMEEYGFEAPRVLGYKSNDNKGK